MLSCYIDTATVTKTQFLGELQLKELGVWLSLFCIDTPENDLYQASISFAHQLVVGLDACTFRDTGKFCSKDPVVFQLYNPEGASVSSVGDASVLDLISLLENNL